MGGIPYFIELVWTGRPEPWAHKRVLYSGSSGIEYRSKTEYRLRRNGKFRPEDGEHLFFLEVVTEDSGALATEHYVDAGLRPLRNERVPRQFHTSGYPEIPRYELLLAGLSWAGGTNEFPIWLVETMLDVKLRPFPMLWGDDWEQWKEDEDARRAKIEAILTEGRSLLGLKSSAA